ncbi:unnamed protein product [Ranitomeya imitator]|uniref:Uncharacterized protein n=1 Tax=Ranitomeya imitator TaxID=111125 RepID=A0ABN9MJU3_9NEOB|nr:unnamed protein product [Ranitomeya imitator]
MSLEILRLKEDIGVGSDSICKLCIHRALRTWNHKTKASGGSIGRDRSPDAITGQHPKHHPTLKDVVHQGRLKASVTSCYMDDSSNSDSIPDMF